MIARIHFTIHTVGINSFSMYRYSTQPVDGIPKTNAETRYQSLSFIQNLNLVSIVLLNIRRVFHVFVSNIVRSL